MGAIGINRAYRSLPDKPDFDPENIIPQPGVYGKYKNSHELMSRLLKWYDMLHTDYARQIGKRRHEYMKNFLDEIKKDIEES